MDGGDVKMMEHFCDLCGKQVHLSDDKAMIEQYFETIENISFISRHILSNQFCIGTPELTQYFPNYPRQPSYDESRKDMIQGAYILLQDEFNLSDENIEGSIIAAVLR